MTQVFYSYFHQVRLIFFLLTTLLAFSAFGQNPDWLPEGTVLRYDYIPFMSPPVVIEARELQVVEAYSIDEMDVRVIGGENCGCGAIEFSESFEVHRRGTQVFFVDTLSNAEFLLYDYGALEGDTLMVLASYSGSASSANMEAVYISDVYQKVFDDTILTVQETQPVGEFGYGDVVVGVGSMNSFFVEYQLCDPLCGGLSRYDDGRRTICFDNSTCYDEDLDFPYAPLPPRTSVFFEGENGKSYALKHKLSSGSNRSVQGRSDLALTTSSDGDCIRTDVGGWAYEYVEVTGDSMLQFSNIDGRLITIYLSRDVGDEWLSYTDQTDSVFAVVTTKDVEVIEGELDTVMCIAFSHAGSPSSTVNSTELCLSRSNGVQAFYGFLHFPLYESAMFPYEEAQRFERIGMQPSWQDNLLVHGLNLNWNGVFDFETGDILHIEETELQDGGGGFVNRDKLIYIDQKRVVNGVEYRWSRERRQYYDLIDSLYTEIRDTFVYSLSDDERNTGSFDHLAGSAVFEIDDPMAGGFSFGSYFNGRVTKTIIGATHYLIDSCWGEILGGIMYSQAPTWISGLAGPYYIRTGGGGIFYGARELKYYKKSNAEEWGSPFDFTVSTAQAQQHHSVLLYPNPASSTLHVKSPGRKGTVTVKLFDLSGILKMRYSGNSEYTIDLGEIPPGIYFYEVRSAISVNTGKLVVTQ